MKKQVVFFVLALMFLSRCSDDDTVIIIPEEPDLIMYSDSSAFEFYEKLSDYGFYSGELASLTPVSSVFPYSLSTPLFSDYTVKDRFIWIPNNTTIGYRASGVLDFPSGTIIIKNFSALDDADQTKRLETRILLLDPFDGEWKAAVYVWTEDQTDALNEINGQNQYIRVMTTSGSIEETLYRIPNITQCGRCHINNEEMLLIGPRARALNFVPEGWSTDHLSKWASEDKLSGLPASGVPVLPDWMDDNAFTLDERARAYLDMNCAHCHNEGGDAGGTLLYLDYDEVDSLRLGFNMEAINMGPGSGGFIYNILPGNADESIIPFRLSSDEFLILMPPIARSLVHEEGLALIREWIDSF